MIILIWRENLISLSSGRKAGGKHGKWILSVGFTILVGTNACKFRGTLPGAKNF